ncbi:non-homologous end-joining DNA ligase [Glycomyces sp. TRM65418]|uniref:non-homologous end-joining DNA ligase n=1 Tax=Glycomyces sp. TRM65418 TaxID=2867006 RepID=UPI001CE54191|nr:non-homologous end-joining DNA ligase [Glycomyces sp. TRM65418]MCC3765171.1 non-homologous end-joining DNA ligase [Glycomyces sp. TRM65418]QZD54796.1 non-homologous end-joining DNA ligase [Glycomyces sp. TRM65418]
MAAETMQVGGHDIKVSNLDKELFPEGHVSKGDMLDHYRAVADAMLPHLAGRPLTLRRYPDGIGEAGFFQKHASDYFPDWVRVVDMPQVDEGSVNHVVCDDEATLLYLANQATIEFHVWLSTVDEPDHPDRLVVDIDPPDGVPVSTLRDVARRARDLYADVGLTPFVQATGGRGFHVVAPLDRSADFDAVRDLADAMADRLAAADPDRLTTAQRKNRRGDRIFLDVNRNAYGQTFIAPYSLRARAGAPVATPLDWAELGRAEPNGHSSTSIRKRLAQKTDPWADIDDHAASAAEARERLDALR